MANLKSALSVMIIPVMIVGCSQKAKISPQNREDLKAGTFLTSDKLTNFTGLSDMIKRDKIPDQTIICTVGSDAINVGDYKLHFRYKQDQAKQMLQHNPQGIRKLAIDARKLGFRLTDRESKDFLDAAIKKGGQPLQDSFKSGQLRREEFEKNVLDTGVVLKAINDHIEKTLLTEIINNSLLLSAARENGLGKIAFNRYVEVKHSDKYKEYLRSTKLTPNQLKDQILEDILVELQKQQIIKNADIRGKEVYDFYQANKENFKHGGRYRWSQILVSDPDVDFQAILSAQTLVDRKYPKLRGLERRKKIKEIKEEKKAKAFDLLKKAKAGQDFATLANTSTEDIPARASKTGGDMGYADLEQLARNGLFKNIASALETMSEGEIYPKPIRTPIGWHIVKLTEKQPPGIIPFEEIKDQIRHILAGQNSDLAIRSWIIKQRETVPIKLSKRFEEFLVNANKIDMDKFNLLKEKYLNEDKTEETKEKSGTKTPETQKSK